MVELYTVVCSLDACNREKIAKYSQPYFLEVIRESYGPDLPNRVIALTYNWRGAAAHQAYQDCLKFRLIEVATFWTNFENDFTRHRANVARTLAYADGGGDTLHDITGVLLDCTA